MNTTEDNNKVLLLIDWENVIYSLIGLGPHEMDLSNRIKKLVEWVKKEIGELLGDNGYVFTPAHFAAYHREICVQNNLRIIICPKRKSCTIPPQKEEDTVDETLMWFGNMMLVHPDVKTICLVSGDEDFVPFLEQAKKLGKKIVLVPPTLSSLSASKKIVRLADKDEATGKPLILILSKIIV